MKIKNRTLKVLEKHFPHWVSAENMRIHQSIVHDSGAWVNGRFFFVSSERFFEGKREYTVRVYSSTRDTLDEVGELGQYATLEEAEEAKQQALVGSIRG